MHHYPRPIRHPHPTYAEFHTPEEEQEVRGEVRWHILLRAILLGVGLVIAAALVVMLARPNGSWMYAILMMAGIMTLIGMPAWIAIALDTAEDTREDAEYEVEQRHQRDAQ